MGALDTFLKDFRSSLDITRLLDPSVENIESTIFTARFSYKYFSVERRQFFEKPQVRFSQREALNDPLEMSVRWKHASTEGMRSYIKTYIAEVTPALFSNTDLLVALAKEHMPSNGIPVTPENVAVVEGLLRSEIGAQFLRQQLSNALPLQYQLSDLVFSHLETELETLRDKAENRSGVLCVTENPLHEQMWALYASGGAGFVVAFDAQHPFFFNEDGTKNLLRKVIYTDEKTDNFWRNPYYSFLVKGASWSSEQEWRMFREFSKCDEKLGTDGLPIYLANVPSEAIRAVYFGYAYEASNIDADISLLLKYGARPEFHQVEANRQKGALESRWLK
jgi:hypothetical protein